MLQLQAEIAKTRKVKEKEALMNKAVDVLQRLIPELGPEHAKFKSKVIGYEETLQKALPALEAQADYMDDLLLGDQKLAYLSLVGANAVAGAVLLAEGQTTLTKGMGPEALKLMQEHDITDAEMAAIKIYTAPDYAYINSGVSRNRGGWLEASIKASWKEQKSHNLGKRSRSGKDNRILGDELQPGHFGPLSPADTAASEGRRHAAVAEEGIRKLDAWKGDTFRGMALTEAEYKREFEDKNTWSAKSFTSTTTLGNVALRFASNAAKEDKTKTKKPILLHFKVTDGRDIKDLSIFGRGEGEILLLPGATATIVDRKMKGMAREVFLEQPAP
ncbi:MAG: hypothetical protein M3O15_07245 [Acidobacteriota bacterium]|nr:hypothetical protein [Acidobacteriota bacterium]